MFVLFCIFEIQNKNMNYKSAYEELETILSEVENEEISIDELSEKLKRATELIKFCRGKLLNTEKEVSSIISKIDKK